MKTKISVVLVICILFSFLGCASGPKKINFNELSSKSFTLFRVFYMTLFDESNREVSEIFASLPVEEIVKQIELRYGVNIDASLFLDNDNNISKVKSYNLAMRNYFVEHDTEETQRVSINFNRLEQNKLTVEVRLRVSNEDGSTSMSDFTTEISYL